MSVFYLTRLSKNEATFESVETACRHFFSAFDALDISKQLECIQWVTNHVEKGTITIAPTAE